MHIASHYSEEDLPEPKGTLRTIHGRLKRYRDLGEPEAGENSDLHTFGFSMNFLDDLHELYNYYDQFSSKVSFDHLYTGNAVLAVCQRKVVNGKLTFRLDVEFQNRSTKQLPPYELLG